MVCVRGGLLSWEREFPKLAMKWLRTEEVGSAVAWAGLCVA